MADYTQNEKVSGLDALPTPDAADVFVVGDVSDSSKAKKTTLAQLATTLIAYIQTSLGGLVQSVTGLNTDNTDPANPVIQISVDGTTIGGDGTPVNPLHVIGGATGGGLGGFDGKTKSYSLEGLEGAPILNGYQNVEAYITVNGTIVNAEFIQDFLQTRDVIADWAAADEVLSYVVNQGFLFLLLVDNATTAYRVYRYDITDLSLGGTLMTIATQTLGTQAGVVMTSNGTDFFFNYKAGNSVNDYVISRYTIAGTTLTFAADITCGAVANATDLIAVFDNGDIYGLNITGSRVFKQFDNGGNLLNTFGPYDSNYDNLINWTETIYIVKSVGDDEAYRVQLETDAPSFGGVVPEQFLGGIVNNDDGSGYECTTSTADGSVMFTRYQNYAANNNIIKRWVKDPRTGMYYVTHTVTEGVGVTNSNFGGLVIVGTFLYSVFDTGVVAGFRYLAADLTGSSALTFSGGLGTLNKGIFSNGTEIFLHSGVAGTWEEYTIGGTTLTYVQDITGAVGNGVASIYSAGRVYMAFGATATVNVYTITGVTFTLIATQDYNQLVLFPEVSNLEGVSLISSVLYLGFNGSYETKVGDRLSCMWLKAFSKPV